MAEVKWIKIVTNIFDDEKIRYIEKLPDGNSMIVLWFKILCLAGKSNSDGFLMLTDKIAYTDEMLTAIFGCSTNLLKVSLNFKAYPSMAALLNGGKSIVAYTSSECSNTIE